jgi:SAM-dependent methyltransferase
MRKVRPSRADTRHTGSFCREVAPYSAIASIYHAVYEEDALHEWLEGNCVLIRRAGIRSGRVLDLGCGTGAGALALAAIGSFDVDGVDSSAEMLASQRYGLYRNVVLGSFESLDVEPDSYDLVCSGFDTLNYLHPDKRAGLFRIVRTALREHAAFVFDIVLEPPKKLGATQLERQIDAGSLLRQTTVYGRSSITTTAVVDFGRGIESACERHVQYYWPLQELEQLSRSLGFRVGEVLPLVPSQGQPALKASIILHVDRLGPEKN